MKPGLKTTELWLTTLAGVLTSTGTIPAGARWPTIVAVVGYALSRGVAKAAAAGGAGKSAADDLAELERAFSAAVAGDASTATDAPDQRPPSGPPPAAAAPAQGVGLGGGAS